ncbi:LysM peptidoglycan-binding domain-containing protein [Aspergillus brunneoviolaceus CBS 621.78]|uniref:Uncharacterized protein n=1 Tax=Aspergillus brunneoviolaceus CBS 621.78 TaxID=1450534 RepID=A0ACD1G1G8_9EURO|nr:hypothetical protein BO95DRAFT_502505 [Aspergillus brunneoviolaceus CBS 621.78]RAH43024.1 hypothetical protein BO95DRAFT_502505 [Aspergillus brunneoviolaceus CBS 621.78]
MTSFHLLLAFLLALVAGSKATMTPPANTTSLSTGSTYSARVPITSDIMPTMPLTPSSIDTAGPPSKTQPGQPGSCNRWYCVKPGDSCQIISERSGASLSLDQLLAWNPELKKDCEHPLIDYWVCVGIPGGSGMTLVYPTGSSNVSIPPYASWTPTPTRNITFEPVVPAPTQAGLVSSCQSFYKAAPDDCSGLRPGYYYCIAAYDNLPLPPHVTTPPHPTPQGTVKNCTAWYQADKEDTCSLIVTMFGTFSREQFVSWNPNLGRECLKLTPGYYYCVGDASTPSTRTAKLPAPTDFPTTYPHQPRVTRDCNKWWLVGPTDTCLLITLANEISVKVFYTWNPDVVGPNKMCEYLPAGFEITRIASSSAPPASTPYVSESTHCSGSVTFIVTSSHTSMPAPTTATTTSCHGTVPGSSSSTVATGHCSHSSCGSITSVTVPSANHTTTVSGKCSYSSCGSMISTSIADHTVIITTHCGHEPGSGCSTVTITSYRTDSPSSRTDFMPITTIHPLIPIPDHITTVTYCPHKSSGSNCIPVPSTSYSPRTVTHTVTTRC